MNTKIGIHMDGDSEVSRQFFPATDTCHSFWILRVAGPTSTLSLFVGKAEAERLIEQLSAIVEASAGTAR